MRIGPIEISWSPATFTSVWHRAPAQAKLVNDMTPEELRRELSLVLAHMLRGNYPYIPKHDEFRRVHFHKLGE
jgi:hypothetical protein